MEVYAVFPNIKDHSYMLYKIPKKISPVNLCLTSQSSSEAINLMRVFEPIPHSIFKIKMTGIELVISSLIIRHANHLESKLIIYV